jgi:hypothetical protein
MIAEKNVISIYHYLIYIRTWTFRILLCFEVIFNILLCFNVIFNIL